MELTKTDLLQTDPNYYKVSEQPDIRDLQECHYLAIQGQSAPEDKLFLNAIEAIYSILFSIKFISKGEDRDFTAPKMECFWYIADKMDKQHLFMQTPRNQWCWKILIRLPEFIDSSYLKRAAYTTRYRKKGSDLIGQVAFETIPAGRFAQILHRGSYEEEEGSLSKLFEHVSKNGFKINGYHREIYLNDPRRVPPEKLQTIIRYSIALNT